jgi:hypothetical protein
MRLLMEHPADPTTFLAGLFGMNLLSHFEHHGSMFYVVSALIAGLMYGLLRASIVHGRQQKLF